MVDILAAGNVYDERIHNNGSSERRVGGSPANFAMAARSLDLDAALVGRVGKDERARFIGGFLEDHGLSFHPVYDDTRTELAVHRVYPNGGSTIRKRLRHEKGANQNLSHHDLDSAVSALQPALVYLSGVDKNRMRADWKGLKTTLKRVDHKMIDLNRQPANPAETAGFFKYVSPEFDFLFFSDSEIKFWHDIHVKHNGAQELTVYPSDPLMKEHKDTLCYATTMLAAGPRNVVVHMEDRGLLCVSANDHRRHVTYALPHKIKNVNPVGAGDASNVGFAYGLLHGADTVESLRMANALGALHAAGKEPRSMAELERFMKHDRRPVIQDSMRVLTR
ncbi:MAG: hypothetical protein HY366_02610 [Candidatus Aenigmarchaeota archaeon]|nr:hypothetical protein [Candidatus Aenigmarchaeota archaeon]